MKARTKAGEHLLNYEGTQNRIRKPRFSVDFVTENSTYHIVTHADDKKMPSNYYTTESIISLTTKNAMEDDAGAFSFVVVGTEEWDTKLNANDLVILRVEPREIKPKWSDWKMDLNGNVIGSSAKVAQNGTLIVGLVSEVRREANYNENIVMYRITGQSLAKALMMFELRPIRQVTLLADTSVGWMGMGSDGGLNVFNHKTVVENVNTALDRFLKYIQFNFEDGNNFIANRLVRDFDSWDDEALADPSPYVNFEGSLNQLLISLVNKPFNELFFDVHTDEQGKSEYGNEKVKIVVRRTPFDKSDWNKLTRHEITSDDVISEELSQNDLDAYSIFNCLPGQSLGGISHMFHLPRYSPALLNKYGYKLLEVENKYISPFSGPSTGESGTAANTSTGTAVKYTKKLFDWYSLNPSFFSGDIEIVGNPDIRLGNRLLYRDVYNRNIWEFYIESVTHSFSYEEGYKTSIGVTRGLKLKNTQDDGRRFSKPAGLALEFKGGFLGELSIEEMEEHNRRREEAEQAGAVYNPFPGQGLSGGIIPEQAAAFAERYAENKNGQTYYSLGAGHSTSVDPFSGGAPYYMDCSAFVYWVYKQFGVNLGTARGYTTWEIAKTPGFLTIGNIGSNINPLTHLRRGDIVFFNNDEHMGIYVGNGNYIGFNGDSPLGGVDTSGGCKTRSMVTGYWAPLWQGHAIRMGSEAGKEGVYRPDNTGIQHLY